MEFELYLKPCYDFVQELLSYGSELEVLAPESLRCEIKNMLKKCVNYIIVLKVMDKINQFINELAKAESAPMLTNVYSQSEKQGSICRHNLSLYLHGLWRITVR